ncbi:MULTISPECIES: type IV secretory system conjugative DNA transfer family protein [unclassified Tolypothrix]|uniref:type IV secretory system conjugative DNA transfer family protein n=1 Tax=unclassified Tolypothrix TaxID=2649714 RepID=UPI0005EAAF4A|nr:MULTISPECIES: type IV secretory system conjugative DNA transfer family protein [unclassified Tolypothrix]BAY96006.1 hypothetical protein NIES3275_80830 [Microchaete diplosiphon NIES-3275]EKE96779.1 hypothetical protein FDUTEX481_06321 [Tolypothrix sp. PCC 7601]MBE9084932.1 hypothetical protein [Tolypothrix sp. LEGE 11397]UYD31143.1 hypothetical protein HGR01_40555 [Tolypothrix sp. PCC 7712]UYD38939.1 hypothetical protein HG267_41345 [Tolypothrix sp. PCC 7601]
MRFLTPAHEAVARSQHSQAMQWFDNLSFDRKVTGITFSLALGIGCGATAYTGMMVTQVKFCLQVRQSALQCQDSQNRPFKMTQEQWDKWGEDGRPDSAVKFRTISPTNPYKPLWAFGAFLGFASSGWMLRHLQESERILSQYRRITEETDLAVARVQGEAEVMLAGTDHTAVIQQAELLASAEVEITGHNVKGQLFEAETAGMSEEEKAEYINFLKSQKTPYLEGTQTLQGIVDPSDKVEGEKDTKAMTGDETATPEPGQANQKQPTENTSPTLEPLNRILGAKRSTLIVGGTGAGKSVTESYMLTKFFQRFPNANVWAIAQKNDSFCGLDKKGRVLLFDPLSPQAAMSAIDEVYNVYDHRRRVTEYRRHEFDNQPVRLILADWHSIYETCKDDQWFSPYLKKISTIITVGRELNVCLLIDTQSFNLAALGLGDSNIRKNLYIIAQGNFSVEEDGTVNDSYGVLLNLITNAKIVDDAEVRAALKARYNQLKPQSKQLGQPLIFISVDPMQLDILPDIRHYKPGQQSKVKLSGYTPEQLNTILLLEFDIDQSPQMPVEVKEEVVQLTQLQQRVLNYLKGKGYKEVDDIRGALKRNGYSTEQIREALAGLVQLEIVNIDDQGRYGAIK